MQRNRNFQEYTDIAQFGLHAIKHFLKIFNFILGALMHNFNRFYILSTFQNNRQSKKGYIVSHYRRELKLVKFNRLASHDWICMFSQISFSAKGTGEYQIHQAFLVINIVIKSLTGLLWGVVECWVGLSTCIPWQRDPWKACRLRALSVIYEFRVCGI